MSPPPKFTATYVVALCLAGLACTATTDVQPGLESVTSGSASGISPGRSDWVRPEAPSDSALLVSTWDGSSKPLSVVRASLIGLTRQLALALRDDGLRARLYARLHASPNPEHKLPFSSMLDADDELLASTLRAANGMNATAFRQVYGGLPPLELYMPVESHFTSWTGGTNLLVGTAARDHEMPRVFDLGGHTVAVLSPDDPPAIPTLVIVPMEGHWSKRSRFAPSFMVCDPERFPGCDDGGGGGGGGDPPPPPPPATAGIVMTFSFIDDDYEGFASGNPEFEVHAFWPQSAADTTAQTDGQCAGESAGDYNREGPGIRSLAYQYNQDDDTWTGTVRLMSGSQIDGATAISNQMLFMVWEDDEERCAIRRSDNEVYGDQYAVKATIPSGYQGVGAYHLPPGLFALDVVGQILSGFTPHNQDDFVGLMVKSGELGESYSDANMSIRGADGVTHGRAMLLRQ